MQKEVIPDLSEFSHLPRFDDGRINYTGVSRAAVLNCAVCYEGQVLLLKRSHKVANYQGKWNFVAGFIDEARPLQHKITEELSEELGLTSEDIAHIRLAQPFECPDPAVQKTWVIYPALVELKRKPEIQLDWEHSDYAWISPEEIRNYDFVSGLDDVLQRALKE